MNDLGAIPAILKSGKERLTVEGKDLDFDLLGFWRWSTSDILSNTTRGKFAEFIVGTTVGFGPDNVSDGWGAFDLTSDDGIKIEVKTSAYIQCWNQKRYSTISFSIRPARYWNPETSVLEEEAKRHADIYVFCLLKHKEQVTIDPLKLDQWEFYILPTCRLDNYKRSQRTITLNPLRKLTYPVDYHGLKSGIEKAYHEQVKFTSYNNK